MYQTDDVELLLPGVCWTHYRHPEQGMYGRLHTCTRDESYWISPPKKKPKNSVDPAKYRNFEDWVTPAEAADMEDGPQKKRWLDRLERSCDPKDRKGFINPKHSNTVWAELIDVQTGWDKAPLTLKERRALLMAFGLKWKQEEIAAHEQGHQGDISDRISNGIQKIVATINGEDWRERVREDEAA